MLKTSYRNIFFLQGILLLAQTLSFISYLKNSFSMLNLFIYLFCMGLILYILELLRYQMEAENCIQHDSNYIRQINFKYIPYIQILCIFFVGLTKVFASYSLWYFYSGLQLLPYLLFFNVLTYGNMIFGTSSVFTGRLWISYHHIYEVKILHTPRYMKLLIDTSDQQECICIRPNLSQNVILELKKHNIVIHDEMNFVEIHKNTLS